MAISCSLADTVIDAGSATTYTFAGRSLGTPATDRLIIVLVNGSVGAHNSTLVSSVTVADITADEIIQINQNNSNAGATSGIFVAAVPTGSTGDVVVTYAAGVNDCGVGLLAATGMNPMAAHTASDTSDPDIKTITVPAGGLLVGGSTGLSSGSPIVAWSNLTEQYDEAIETNAAHSGAFDIFLSAQSNRSITADWSGGSQAANVMALASFPAIVPATGTLSQTLANASLSSGAAIQIKAALAKTLADATLAATGSFVGAAQLSQTLANVSLSSNATISLAAALAKTLGDAILSSAATVEIVGELALSLANATLSSSAAVQIKAALGGMLADASLSALAQLNIQAALGQTFDDALVTAEGISIISAALGVRLDDAMLISTGNDGWTRRGPAGGTWTPVPRASGTWTPVPRAGGSWTPVR